jgi:hypothetical protein
MPFKYNSFSDEMDYYADTLPTIKLTDLTDGYVPYHVSDAVGLANSPIYTDGTLVGIGTVTPGAPLDLVIDNATGNSISTAFLLERTTSATPASGLGVALAGRVENSANAQYIASRISTILTTVTSGSEIARLDFQVGAGANHAAIAASLRMSITGDGFTGLSTSAPVCRLEVEDDGTTAAMLVKITQDDASVYGLVIGNDTYSTTDTNGLLFKVADTGAPTISWTAGVLTLSDDTLVDGDLEVTGAIKYVFPVGGYYFNSTGVDPATELGYGTWTQVGQGQFLVGAT